MKAVITGVGKRLGCYLAHQLLDQGWQVFGCYRSETSELAGLAEKGAQLLKVDLTDLLQLDSWLKTLKAEQAIDLVIHNASIYPQETNDLANNQQNLTACFQVHVMAPYSINENLADQLKAANNGQIIHITDIYAANPNEISRGYCATKAALSSLSKSYAKLLAPRVRVNSIEPGPIAFLDEHNAQYRNDVLAQTPLKTEGGFEPIWQVVQMLLANKYMTGTNIPVDGGRSLKAGC